MPTPLNSLINCCAFDSKLESWSVAKTPVPKQRKTKKSNVLIGINPNLFLHFKIEYSCLLFFSVLVVDFSFLVLSHYDIGVGFKRKRLLEEICMALEKNENFFELTDESDRASAIEAQFNEDALENARRKTLPETNPDFDGLHCIDCDEKIPAARLKLGKIRCVECQTVLEKQGKFFAG